MTVRACIAIADSGIGRRGDRPGQSELDGDLIGEALCIDCEVERERKGLCAD
jgi:hypothetical protein